MGTAAKLQVAVSGRVCSEINLASLGLWTVAPMACSVLRGLPNSSPAARPATVVLVVLPWLLSAVYTTLGTLLCILPWQPWGSLASTTGAGVTAVTAPPQGLGRPCWPAALLPCCPSALLPCCPRPAAHCLCPLADLPTGPNGPQWPCRHFHTRRRKSLTCTLRRCLPFQDWELLRCTTELTTASADSRRASKQARPAQFADI